MEEREYAKQALQGVDLKEICDDETLSSLRANI